MLVNPKAFFLAYSTSLIHTSQIPCDQQGMCVNIFRAGGYHLFCALIGSNFRNSAKPFLCVLSSTCPSCATPCSCFHFFSSYLLASVLFVLLLLLSFPCPLPPPPQLSVCLLTLDQHFTPVFQQKGL